MYQRETIFCEDQIDKIDPPKHHSKRAKDQISKKTGIDFRKGFEEQPPKPREDVFTVRNLNIS